MEIQQFGLGIRFDMINETITDAVKERIFRELFSVLDHDDVRDLKIYGKAEPENIFMVIFSNGKFSQMKLLTKKLLDDAEISMLLSYKMPFLETNRLLHVDGAEYYGCINGDGCFVGGDKSFDVKLQSGNEARKSTDGTTIILAPDSFKGTFSSKEAIDRLTIAARKAMPGVKTVPIPIADGGEGTVDALVTACRGAIKEVDTQNPLGEPIKAKYGVLYGDTAVIEMAAASGLTLIKKEQRDIMSSGSFGTGLMIKHALLSGFRDIIIGIGGSATNDGGMGCAIALGARFLDERGNELSGIASELVRVRSIDTSGMLPAVKEAHFAVMCDVNNPLTGKNGATMVYGPQKGATNKNLFDLELGMRIYKKALFEHFGVDRSEESGAGAAGGMGLMAMCFLNAELKCGIDAMLDAIRFDRLLKSASLVVTGEGRLDAQTISGNKAVMGIVKRCGSAGVPAAIIAGSIETDILPIYSLCNASAFSVIDKPMSAEEAVENADAMFDDAAFRMFKMIRLLKKNN